MKRRLLLFGALLLFFLQPVADLLAQQPAYTQTVDYLFGQTMRFSLVAENVPPLTAVTLFLRAPEFPNALAEAVPFTDATPLTVTYALDLGRVRLAPFTQLTYWWTLTTAAGELLETPPQQVTYEDNRFVWQSKTAANVTAHWTGTEPALGQLALDIVNEVMPDLRELLPVSDLSAQELHIYMYPTSADLRAALRLTGRDWVGAHAHPELGVILVTAVNPRTAATDLRQSLPHELAHYLLYQATGARYEALPLWLSEGVATLAERAPNPTYAQALQTAVANQATLPFTQLCAAFPNNEPDLLLAYAQSESLVRFVQANYGNHALREMVTAVADGADCLTVTTRSLGHSLEELNNAWLRSLQPRPFWQQFWLNNGPIFLLVLFGFLFTALIALTPGRK